MVKPSKVQAVELANLRDFVIEVMMAMEVWSEEQLTKLLEIDLGLLRKNATQRHGVTRWKRGVLKPTNPEQVEVIDLHPRLLSQEWMPYAAWVLHHEFVHALGYTAHDSTFRSLEALGPVRNRQRWGHASLKHCAGKRPLGYGYVRIVRRNILGKNLARKILCRIVGRYERCAQ